MKDREVAIVKFAVLFCFFLNYFRCRRTDSTYVDLGGFTVGFVPKSVTLEYN